MLSYRLTTAILLLGSLFFTFACAGGPPQKPARTYIVVHDDDDDERIVITTPEGEYVFSEADIEKLEQQIEAKMRHLEHSMAKLEIDIPNIEIALSEIPDLPEIVIEIPDIRASGTINNLNPQQRQRLKRYQQLYREEPSTAVPKLIEALQSEDHPALRYKLVQYIGCFAGHSPEAREALSKIAKFDDSLRLRRKAAAYLSANNAENRF